MILSIMGIYEIYSEKSYLKKKQKRNIPLLFVQYILRIHSILMYCKSLILIYSDCDSLLITLSHCMIQYYILLLKELVIISNIIVFILPYSFIAFFRKLFP